MLAVSQPHGLPAIQVAASDGKLALRGAYAWTLLQGLATALTATSDPSHRRLLDELTGRLAAELDSASERRPLLNLLCDALGPNARWAALVEGRPPFTESPGLRAIHRWWYAPWFCRQDPRPHPGLLQIAAVLCVCLAAGVLVRGFSDDTPSARFERASAGVSNEVHFGDAAPLAAAPQEVAPADFPDVRFNTPAAKDSATLAMQEEQEPPQDQQGQLGGVPKAARGMREYQAAERPKAEPSAPAKKQSAPSLLSSKPSTASRGAEARKQDSKSSWADADEMKPRDAAPRSNTASLDDLAEGEASATIPRQASSGRASSNSIFGSSEGASVAAGGSLSKPAEPPASAPRDDAYGNSMPSASAPARPATQSTPAPMADAVVAEERAESSKKMSKAEASAPSLADVERQYARDNYAKALEDAESYLRSGQGSNQERARHGA